MGRTLIRFRDVTMAVSADFQISGRFFDNTLVGFLLIRGFLIPLVAETAAVGKVHILAQDGLINEVALVICFRADRRRWAGRSDTAGGCRFGNGNK